MPFGDRGENEYEFRPRLALIDSENCTNESRLVGRASTQPALMQTVLI